MTHVYKNNNPHEKEEMVEGREENQNKQQTSSSLQDAAANCTHSPPLMRSILDVIDPQCETRFYEIEDNAASNDGVESEQCVENIKNGKSGARISQRKSIYGISTKRGDTVSEQCLKVNMHNLDLSERSSSSSGQYLKNDLEFSHCPTDVWCRQPYAISERQKESSFSADDPSCSDNPTGKKCLFPYDHTEVTNIANNAMYGRQIIYGNGQTSSRPSTLHICSHEFCVVCGQKSNDENSRTSTKHKREIKNSVQDYVERAESPKHFPIFSGEDVIKYYGKLSLYNTQSVFYGCEGKPFFVDVDSSSEQQPNNENYMKTNKFRNNENNGVFKETKVFLSNGRSSIQKPPPTYNSLRDFILQDEPPKYETVTGNALTAELEYDVGNIPTRATTTNGACEQKMVCTALLISFTIVVFAFVVSAYRLLY